MAQHYIRIEVAEGKVKEILDKMTEAQRTIHECCRELESLGVVKVVPKEEAASGN